MTDLTKYITINIRKYFEFENSKDGEDLLSSDLSDFSCPKNPDVEKFLKQQAIEFTKKNQSVTSPIPLISTFSSLPECSDSCFMDTLPFRLDFPERKSCMADFRTSAVSSLLLTDRSMVFRKPFSKSVLIPEIQTLRRYSHAAIWKNPI